MTEQLPPIYFHLPTQRWPNPFPSCANDLRPVDGASIWILQTYLRLKESGFACELVDTIPEEGIVIGHRETVPYDFRPAPKLLLACVKGDQNPQPYAQIHIVQNREEVKSAALKVQSIGEERYLLPGKRYFLPHWPQPGLIPRDPSRGDTFENVVYFGITYNLAPPLRKPQWKQQIDALGLTWYPQTNGDRWHDYSNVDVVVAVRSFEGQTYPWKPPTKLYQAWHAQVPAILGAESAFQAERKSPLDYFEVTNESQIIDYLKEMRDDKALRQKIAKNCRERAKETQPDQITQCWRTFIMETCIPAYQQWCSLSLTQQQQFFFRRYLAIKISKLQMKFVKFVNFSS